MAIVEGTSEAPQDAVGRRLLGMLGPDNLRFWLPRADGVNNLRVAPFDNQGVPYFTPTNPANILGGGSNAIAYDNSTGYTANTASGTVVNLDFSTTGAQAAAANYMVTIFNASTASQMSASMQVVETFNSVVKYSTLQHTLNPLIIPANTTRSWFVQGWLMGASYRLAFTNATTIENAVASIYVRIRRA